MRSDPEPFRDTADNTATTSLLHRTDSAAA